MGGGDIGARWNRMWGREGGENVPNAHVLKAYGEHVLKTPMNATGRREPTARPTIIELTEATLIGQTAGWPMIDLTHSRHLKLYAGRWRAPAKACLIDEMQIGSFNGQVLQFSGINVQIVDGQYERPVQRAREPDFRVQRGQRSTE